MYNLISDKASVVAQKVNNLPAMRETMVQSLGWEDPLVKEMATHSILSWEIPWTSMGSLADSRVRRVAKRQTRLSD